MMAVQAAKLAGISLNEWTEKVIRDACDAANVSPESIYNPDQFSLDSLVGEPEETLRPSRPADSGALGSAPAPTRDDLNPFAVNCQAGAYHWKHRPGHPCRSCGGEA